MCTNGVNHGQLQLLLEIAEEQTAVVGGWMKEIAHLAGHAEVAETEIAAAMASLKTARRALEDAVDVVKDAPASSGVEVTVV